ncbi:hypothetical protein M885DRAFT_217483 [Pelagophyceae sp. CCMP2097]|nr:hypothetical protein M885DRAFT_217483 [Pelagophyceae sp. CCMP2097]
MIWTRKAKVCDSGGQLRSRFSSGETAEYGDMGVIRRFAEPQTRTFSHKDVVFPNQRSMAREIKAGFRDTAVNGPWERKILETQGQRPTQLTQRDYFTQLRHIARAAG